MAVNKNDYAVVVGINFYPGGLRPLKAAVSDAVRFAEWLIDLDGGALMDDNIALILSDEDNCNKEADPITARPIKQNIDDAIRRYVRKSKAERRGRRLYFYFAGHGLGIDFDEIALLMANSEPDLDAWPNIGARSYRRYFRNQAPFDEIIFFLDCCRDFDNKATPGIPEFKVVQREDAPFVQDFLAFATRYGKKAFEPILPGEKQRQGMFTSVLLKGLRGAASDPETREVTTDSLKDYLILNLPKAAQASGRKQMPDFEGNAGRIVLCSTEPASVKIPLDGVPGAASDVVVSNGFGKEIQRYSAGDIPTRIRLANGLYSISYPSTGRQRILIVDSEREPPYEFR